MLAILATFEVDDDALRVRRPYRTKTGTSYVRVIRPASAGERLRLTPPGGPAASPRSTSIRYFFLFRFSAIFTTYHYPYSCVNELTI